MKDTVDLQNMLRRQKVRFWGRDYFITPQLVSWIHGDGQQIIYFQPLDTRPNYYVVRIDRKINLNNTDKSRCFCDEVLDELYEHIEEEFGGRYEEWTSSKNGRTYKRRNPWPALSDDSGSCWGALR